MIQEFYCTNTREYTNIPSCWGELVFDSPRLQEGIFVYTYTVLVFDVSCIVQFYECITLVRLYNKANIKKADERADGKQG